MDKTNKKQSNNFLRGLIWGAIIGGGVVYYLKTESGKEFVKKLKSQALDQLSQLGDTMTAEEEVEPLMPVHHHYGEESERSGVSDSIKILHVHKGQVDGKENPSENHTHTEKKGTQKKLFKGIGKK